MKSPAMVAIAIILMGGCASIFAGPQSAMDAEVVTSAKADDIYSDPMFLGMFALDGSIDVDAMKATIEAEAKEEGIKTDFLDAFEFNVRNGEHGDGLAGSWFSAYAPDAEWEQEEFLVVQAIGSATNHFIFSEETMVAQETSQPLPIKLLENLGLMQESTAEPCQSGSKVTTTIDSPAAARIAHEQPEFAEFVAENPGLDYIYGYAPSFVECDDWEDGDMWLVAYTDADAWLNGDEADGAVVFMDGDGEVVELWPFIGGQPTSSASWRTWGNGMVSASTPTALTGPASQTIEVDVWDTTVNVFAIIEADMDLQVVDGAGNEVPVETSGTTYYVDQDHPAPGLWTFTLSYETLLPDNRAYTYDIRGVT